MTSERAELLPTSCCEDFLFSDWLHELAPLSLLVKISSFDSPPAVVLELAENNDHLHYFPKLSKVYKTRQRKISSQLQ